MKKETITIDRYIRRNDKKIHKLIKQAISDNSSIHIASPTGTGKTQLIIEIVNRFGKDYQILILEPQIAIINQLQYDLKQRKIKSFNYNSTTKKKFSKKDLNNPIICTYDSAHNLIDKSVGNLKANSLENHLLLNPSKTIVIMDETHVLIQDGKLGYDKSIRAILGASVPLIGFSATPSFWVIEKLFDFDTSIVVTSKNIPNKQLVPLLIKHNIASTLAYHIVSDCKYGKVVIYTSSITMQNRIRDEILSLDKSKNVLILNRPERMNKKKREWNFLMKNGVLPKEVDILIMNKVAQAGINIKDKNIEAVFLLGQFDPYGFLQYMGRTRNYLGQYYYVYNTYGDGLDMEDNNSNKDLGSALIENILSNVNRTIRNITNNSVIDNKSLVSTFGDNYSVDHNGNIVPNKCVIAKSEYSKYGKLLGLDLLNIVERIDSKIEVTDIEVIEPVVQLRKKKRAKIKKNIPTLISETALELVQLMNNLKYDKLTHDDILYHIERSVSNEIESLMLGVPKISKIKKRKLKRLISEAMDIGLGVPKLIAAAKSYINTGNDLNAINKIINNSISNRKIVNALKAKLFFNSVRNQPKTRIKIVDALEEHIGEQYQKQRWINAIKKVVNYLPGSDDLAVLIYDLFCIFKDSQKMIGGKKIKQKKLIQIVRNYDEYVNATGVDLF